MSFSVSVREHVMIAHSLDSDFFGPAKKLHGATYVVSASFHATHLNEYNVVVDIGAAQEGLRDALAPLAYQNLDELPIFEDQLTTTEFLCQWIHGQVSTRLEAPNVERLTIELKESHIAWAEYSAPLS